MNRYLNSIELQSPHNPFPTAVKPNRKKMQIKPPKTDSFIRGWNYWCFFLSGSIQIKKTVDSSFGRDSLPVQTFRHLKNLINRIKIDPNNYKLQTDRDHLLEQIIKCRDKYLQIDDVFNKEITTQIIVSKDQISCCNWLKT